MKTPTHILTLCHEVMAGRSRSYVDTSRTFAQYITELDGKENAIEAQLREQFLQLGREYADMTDNRDSWHSSAPGDNVLCIGSKMRLSAKQWRTAEKAGGSKNPK